MKKIFALLMALFLIPAALPVQAAQEQEPRRVETAADADEWIAVFLGEHPEDLDGVWEMTAQMNAAAASLGGMKGLAGQLAALGKVEKIEPAYAGELKNMEAFYIPCVFAAMPVDLVLVMQDGAIAGLVTGAYSGGKEEEEEAGSDLYESIELALPVPELGELPGVLTVPAGDGPFPAVILLQGSGPSDRDETIGSLKPFKDIAEGLAGQGVAAYRFDKRTYTYGAEIASDLQFTLEDEYVEDAVNAVRLVARQEKIDPERIFVLGHSLGGSAVPAVAAALEEQASSDAEEAEGETASDAEEAEEETASDAEEAEEEAASEAEPAGACGYILLAAAARPIDELMREQYEFLYSLMPEDTEEEKQQKAEASAQLEEIFAELDRLDDLDSLSGDDMVAGAYPAYWKWLAGYDIIGMAGEITRPVLLLQGEEDYQVTTEDFAIWQEAFGEKDNWQLTLFPGLTHAFTPGEKAEGPDAYARGEKVDEAVIRAIADFVK